MNSVPPFRRLFLLCLVAALMVFPLGVIAQAPGWWAERGVLNPAQPANDYAAVNQGQARNLAQAAAAELNAHLPGGAGAEVNQLVAGWSSPTSTPDNYAAINLGQLKNLAKPFYDRLIAAGYTTAYPWAGHEARTNDYALANLGQVKNLFSFDLLKDADQPPNGLPDWWEQYWNGSTGLAPGGDADGDGLTNLEEWQRGTNPLAGVSPNPENVRIQCNADGSLDFSWEDHAEGEEYYKVVLYRDDGTIQTWVLPPNSTFYHVTPVERWPHGRP